MAIPDFQSIMLPLLKITSDESEHDHSEVRDALAAQFDISDSEKKEMLPSGKQARFDNRVAWAIVYLRRAGLIENTRRGIFRITRHGLELLNTNPDKIDIKLLRRLYPEFRNWRKPSQQELSEPFSKIFTDYDEAKWAFIFLKETLEGVGVKDPEDKRFAVTLPKKGNSIRLIFGQWMILDFKSPEFTENRVTLTFRKDLVNINDRFITFSFAKNAEEPDVNNYSLPLEMVRPLDGDLRNAYGKTLEYIKEKFGSWEKTPWREDHHREDIGKAIFDPVVLDDLLTGGIPQDPPEIYTLEQLTEDTYQNISTLKSWLQSINRKGQAIIYGPPGTGKTFVAEHLARHLVSGGDGFVDLVQFHPAYAYEDFIQGIRPQAREDGILEYSVIPGRFLNFCQRANECQGTSVLIIDEINRANLARVFGELMYLLEYRDKKIPLSVDGTPFKIPNNVRIIGTMNTADRSIALVDHALRRRFAFLKLQPDYEVLKRYHQRENTGFPVEGLVQVLQDLNRSINDPHYELGISYFLKPDLKDHLEDIWKMEIEPYLDEYFFDNRKSADKFRWESVRPALGL